MNLKGSPKNFKNFKTFAIKYGGRKIGKISRESTPPKIINFMSKKFLLFCKIINFVKPFANACHDIKINKVTDLQKYTPY